MLKKSLYLVPVTILLIGLLARVGFGRWAFAQGDDGVGKIVEADKGGDPVEEPSKPEPPVYDPPMKGGCGDGNTTSAGTESALFSHMAGYSSFPRHDTMLKAAVRIPLMFETREGATASFRTTPELGMGTMADFDGRSRVALQFHITKIDGAAGTEVFHPFALSFHPEYQAEYIYSGTPINYLRQLLTDDTLTDITILDPNGPEEGYVIRSYRRADQLGPQDLNTGIYDTIGQPYLESKVYNPNVRGTYTGHVKVRVTERPNSGPEVVKIYSWDINPTTDITTFEELHPKSNDASVFYPLKKTVISRFPLADNDYEQIREEYETISPAMDLMALPTMVVVSRDYEKYTYIDDEKRLVQLKTAVDASGGDTSETLTTDFTYYQSTVDLYRNGRPDTVERSDGMWWKYEYSHNYSTFLRVFKTYTPFGNTSIANYAQGKLETVTISGDTYTKVVSVGPQEISKEVKTSSVVNNKLVIKTERGHNTLGGALVSFAVYNNDDSTVTGNRIHSKVNEDGTVELHTYTDLGNGDGSYSERIESGGGSYDSNTGLVTSVNTGTKSTTLYNAHGKVYAQSNEDIASGLTLDFWSAIEPGNGPNAGTLYVDEFGRPTKRFYNGNPDDVATWEYSCCGYENTVSRSGASTMYERDLLKRVVSVSRTNSSIGTPIEATTQYQGLTTLREQTAGGQTLLVAEATRSLGSNIVTTWSPDADGQINTLSMPAPTAYPNAEYSNREVIYNTAGQGRTTIFTSPDGAQTSMTTYCDGSQHTIVDQAGCETTYEYGTHNEQGGGLWTKTTSPISTQWVKTFVDSVGRSIKTEYPDGATDTSTYYSAVDAAGSRGKLASNRDADENDDAGTGTYVTYTYGVDGELASVVEAIADGHTRLTAIDHDVVNTVSIHGTTISPAIRSTEMVNGVVTSTSYSSTDGYVSATDSLGGNTLSVRSLPDDGGWTVTSTNPDGQVVVQAYSDGRLVSTHYYQNDYVANGASTAVTYTLGTYDAFGRSLVTTTARTGDTSVTLRLPNGAVRSVETNNGADTTSYVYDSMGRVIVTTLPDGNTTRNSYTPRGKILATWGSQTYARLYQYDALGRMFELRTYQDLAHDVEPDVVMTAGFAKTTWDYDAERGWLTEENYDGETGNGPGNVADYAYTPSGRPKTRTWERGVVTTYEYDQGALAKVSYSNDPTGTPSIEYTHDDYGRLVTVYQDATATQGANTHTYLYDPNALTLESETIKYDIDVNGVAALTRVLAPTKDSLLRPTGYALKDGASVEHAVTHTYDLAGRLHSVSETHQSPALDFVYHYEQGSTSLVEFAVGPVHTVENTYEPHRNVLTNKENSITATNEVISNFAYTTNNIGQRTNLTTSGSAFAAGTAPIYTWSYNGRGELIQADDSSAANIDRAFQYDGIGNREASVNGMLADLTDPSLAVNYEVNALNQYTEIDNTLSPIHDTDGNATAYPLPAAPGELSTLVWNGENRLISVEVVGSSTSTYSYDFRGRRISKKVGAGQVTRYVYEGWNAIGEYAGETLARSYTWGMDLSGSMQRVGGVGGLLAVHVGAANFYPTYDDNGNVGEYLDTNCVIAAHYEYDAFGNETAMVIGGGAPLFSHRFSTKPMDDETGLSYYGYRYYGPVTGRWMSRDPLGELGGIALYAFVSNNGTNAVDVLGLQEGSLDNLLPPIPSVPTPPNYADEHYRDVTRAGGNCWRCHTPPPNVGGGGPLSLYAGFDVGLIGGGGATLVTCCDEGGTIHIMGFAKVCFGAMVGGGVSGGIVSGIDGESCRPEKYSGWFLETSVGGAVMGGGADIGLERGKNGLPSPTGVNEIGIGFGLAIPVQVYFCNYYFLFDISAGCCK